MLIGAWWPSPPIESAAAVDFWSGHMSVKQEEAEEVNKLATWLGERNSGNTSEDMLNRLALGRNRLLDVAHHCRTKSEANDSVVKAVNHLREMLKGIAKWGNEEIDKILKDKELADKPTKIGEVVFKANQQASNAAMAGLTRLLESQTTASVDHGDKTQAWATASAAVTHLRSRLTEICEAGDQACNATAAAALPDAAKLKQLNSIKDRVNSDAAGASRAAVAKIVGVVQQVLEAADISENAAKWLAAHGFNIEEPQPPPPITVDRLC